MSFASRGTTAGPHWRVLTSLRSTLTEIKGETTSCIPAVGAISGALPCRILVATAASWRSDPKPSQADSRTQSSPSARSAIQQKKEELARLTRQLREEHRQPKQKHQQSYLPSPGANESAPSHSRQPTHHVISGDVSLNDQPSSTHKGESLDGGGYNSNRQHVGEDGMIDRSAISLSLALERMPTTPIHNVLELLLFLNAPRVRTHFIKVPSRVVAEEMASFLQYVLPFPLVHCTSLNFNNGAHWALRITRAPFDQAETIVDVDLPDYSLAALSEIEGLLNAFLADGEVEVPPTLVDKTYSFNRLLASTNVDGKHTLFADEYPVPLPAFTHSDPMSVSNRSKPPTIVTDFYRHGELVELNQLRDLPEMPGGLKQVEGFKVEDDDDGEDGEENNSNAGQSKRKKKDRRKRRRERRKAKQKAGVVEHAEGEKEEGKDGEKVVVVEEGEAGEVEHGIEKEMQELSGADANNDVVADECDVDNQDDNDKDEEMGHHYDTGAHYQTSGCPVEDARIAAIRAKRALIKEKQLREGLPVYKLRTPILHAIENHQVVILSGGTGTGKTTQVPQFILDYEYAIRASRGHVDTAAMSHRVESLNLTPFNEQYLNPLLHRRPPKIICVQPRRIASLTLGMRVAEERGLSIGDYLFRESKAERGVFNEKEMEEVKEEKKGEGETETETKEEKGTEQGNKGMSRGWSAVRRVSLPSGLVKVMDSVATYEKMKRLEGAKEWAQTIEGDEDGDEEEGGNVDLGSPDEVLTRALHAINKVEDIVSKSRHSERAKRLSAAGLEGLSWVTPSKAKEMKEWVVKAMAETSTPVTVKRIHPVQAPPTSFGYSPKDDLIDVGLGYGGETTQSRSLMYITTSLLETYGAHMQSRGRPGLLSSLSPEAVTKIFAEPRLTSLILQTLHLYRDATHIIFDEAHERDTHTDLMLALVKLILPYRPDLRVIIMSATLDDAVFHSYFPSAPMLHVEGRLFPVQSLFLEDVVDMLKYSVDLKGAPIPSFLTLQDSNSVRDAIRKRLKEDTFILHNDKRLTPSQWKDRTMQLDKKALTQLSEESSAVSMNTYPEPVKQVVGLLGTDAPLTTLADLALRLTEYIISHTSTPLGTAMRKHITDAADLEARLIAATTGRSVTVSSAMASLRLKHHRGGAQKNETGDTTPSDDDLLPEGSILIVTPSWAAISELVNAIESHPVLANNPDVAVFALHSILPLRKQIEKISRSHAQCKIFVATNIAESSVTLPNVRYVIDLGFVKRKLWLPARRTYFFGKDTETHMNLLQRAGRAGRGAPGMSFHFLSKATVRDISPHVYPHMAESSLLDTVTAVAFLARPWRLSPSDITHLRSIIPHHQLPSYLSASSVFSTRRSLVLTPHSSITSVFSLLPTPPSRTRLFHAIQELIDVGVLNTRLHLRPSARKIMSVSRIPSRQHRLLTLACLLGCLDPVLTFFSLPSYPLAHLDDTSRDRHKERSFLLRGAMQSEAMVDIAVYSACVRASSIHRATLFEMFDVDDLNIQEISANRRNLFETLKAIPRLKPLLDPLRMDVNGVLRVAETGVPVAVPDPLVIRELPSPPSTRFIESSYVDYLRKNLRSLRDSGLESWDRWAKRVYAWAQRPLEEQQSATTVHWDLLQDNYELQKAGQLILPTDYALASIASTIDPLGHIEVPVGEPDPVFHASFNSHCYFLTSALIGAASESIAVAESYPSARNAHPFLVFRGDPADLDTPKPPLDLAGLWSPWHSPSSPSDKGSQTTTNDSTKPDTINADTMEPIDSNDTNNINSSDRNNNNTNEQVDAELLEEVDGVVSQDPWDVDQWEADQSTEEDASVSSIPPSIPMKGIYQDERGGRMNLDNLPPVSLALWSTLMDAKRRARLLIKSVPYHRLEALLIEANRLLNDPQAQAYVPALRGLVQMIQQEMRTEHRAREEAEWVESQVLTLERKEETARGFAFTADVLDHVGIEHQRVRSRIKTYPSSMVHTPQTMPSPLFGYRQSRLDGGEASIPIFSRPTPLSPLAALLLSPPALTTKQRAGVDEYLAKYDRIVDEAIKGLGIIEHETTPRNIARLSEEVKRRLKQVGFEDLLGITDPDAIIKLKQVYAEIKKAKQNEEGGEGKGEESEKEGQELEASDDTWTLDDDIMRRDASGVNIEEEEMGDGQTENSATEEDGLEGEEEEADAGDGEGDGTSSLRKSRNSAEQAEAWVMHEMLSSLAVTRIPRVLSVDTAHLRADIEINRERMKADGILKVNQPKDKDDQEDNGTVKDDDEDEQNLVDDGRRKTLWARPHLGVSLKQTEAERMALLYRVLWGVVEGIISPTTAQDTKKSGEGKTPLEITPEFAKLGMKIGAHLDALLRPQVGDSTELLSVDIRDFNPVYTITDRQRAVNMVKKGKPWKKGSKSKSPKGKKGTKGGSGDYPFVFEKRNNSSDNFL